MQGNALRLVHPFHKYIKLLVTTTGRQAGRHWGLDKLLARSAHDAPRCLLLATAPSEPRSGLPPRQCPRHMLPWPPPQSLPASPRLSPPRAAALLRGPAPDALLHCHHPRQWPPAHQEPKRISRNAAWMAAAQEEVTPSLVCSSSGLGSPRFAAALGTTGETALPSTSIPRDTIARPESPALLRQQLPAQRSLHEREATAGMERAPTPPLPQPQCDTRV